MHEWHPLDASQNSRIPAPAVALEETLGRVGVATSCLGLDVVWLALVTDASALAQASSSQKSLGLPDGAEFTQSKGPVIFLLPFDASVRVQPMTLPTSAASGWIAVTKALGANAVTGAPAGAAYTTVAGGPVLSVSLADGSRAEYSLRPFSALSGLQPHLERLPEGPDNLAARARWFSKRTGNKD